MAKEIKRHSQSGQAIVEYLLLCAIIVGIIGGVLKVAAYKWLDEKVSRLRDPMIAVLSQSQKGIPMHWFFAGRDIGEVNQRFRDADRKAEDRARDRDNQDNGDSGDNGDDLSDKDKLSPNGGDGANSPDSDGPGSGGGKDGPGGANPSRTNAPGASRNPPSKSKSTDADSSRGSAAGLKGRRGSESDDDDGTGKKNKKKSSGIEGFDSGYDAETGKATADLNDDGKIDEKDDEIAAEKAEEEKALSPEARAKRRVLEEQQSRSSKGCRKLSTFELIRMGIFIMVGFVGFIVLFASRGKSGD